MITAGSNLASVTVAKISFGEKIKISNPIVPSVVSQGLVAERRELHWLNLPHH